MSQDKIESRRAFMKFGQSSSMAVVPFMTKATKTEGDSLSSSTSGCVTGSQKNTSGCNVGIKS